MSESTLKLNFKQHFVDDTIYNEDKTPLFNKETGETLKYEYKVQAYLKSNVTIKDKLLALLLSFAIKENDFNHFNPIPNASIAKLLNCHVSAAKKALYSLIRLNLVTRCFIGNNRKIKVNISEYKNYSVFETSNSFYKKKNKKGYTTQERQKRSIIRNRMFSWLVSKNKEEQEENNKKLNKFVNKQIKWNKFKIYKKFNNESENINERELVLNKIKRIVYPPVYDPVFKEQLEDLISNFKL